MKIKFRKFLIVLSILIYPLINNTAYSGDIDDESIFNAKNTDNRAGRAFLTPFDFEIVMATPSSHIVFNFTNTKAIEKENNILNPLTYKNDDEFWDIFIGNFFINAFSSHEDLTPRQIYETRQGLDKSFSEKQIIQVGEFQVYFSASNNPGEDVNKRIQNIKNYPLFQTFTRGIQKLFTKKLEDLVSAEYTSREQEIQRSMYL